MTDLLDGVRAGNIRAGDGAMGTMLQSAGLDDGGAPEQWNVDRPEEIERKIKHRWRKALAELKKAEQVG